ncbi:hypothetical protein [Lihuaxuella thermophila]|uniref:Uncharacterized protein n=1 Tax=Lihuaxuella thermophila TaxID=1173111 RepID=A0A1H8ATV3_9BACL|nr:hypothetical protein [Lihuaxuella thermophila]SEM73238.1 hypothetical protein SAMN05444955_101309 [Lihuaxuella thermophila]
MRRQTVFTMILGGLLALIASRWVRPRNRMDLIRRAVSMGREIRQNVFFGRLVSGAVARKLLRRFQWAR